jgi:glycosyltransferase involved in cell wall biosynthesis
MTRTIFQGFRKAAAVACVSFATRDQVLSQRLVPEERLTVNPNGVAQIFNPRPDPCADQQVRRLLGPQGSGSLEILHVGSTIARKRIDLLLRIFATVRRELSPVRMIRVGGPFIPTQRELIHQLNLPPDSVRVLPFLDHEVLAAVYRRATLAVLPSEAEGFGLPLLEAMACGTPVVASDIPALREVGGPSATYCRVGDMSGWADAILSLLRERRERPQCWSERAAAGARWATRFTWEGYADRAVQLYQTVAAS